MSFECDEQGQWGRKRTEEENSRRLAIFSIFNCNLKTKLDHLFGHVNRQLCPRLLCVFVYKLVIACGKLISIRKSIAIPTSTHIFLVHSAMFSSLYCLDQHVVLRSKGLSYNTVKCLWVPLFCSRHCVLSKSSVVINIYSLRSPFQCAYPNWIEFFLISCRNWTWTMWPCNGMYHLYWHWPINRTIWIFHMLLRQPTAPTYHNKMLFANQS